MNIYEKLIDLLIAILVMIIFPAIYVSKKTELLSYEALNAETQEFVSDVTTHQCISKERYEAFLSRVSMEKEAVTIEMSVDEIVYEPIEGTVYSYHQISSQREILDKLYTGKKEVALVPGTYFEIILSYPKNSKKILCCGGAVR